ncbi:IS110 family transposase [Mycobacterium sp. 050128]|uniref:IS110 family transposase n=1 Tax=Mycobacterium TaxID=1763 RepID=UPI0004BC5DE8|nr:IS110 family transposase [Mycobacterium intracellulare]ASL18800.1 transposase [Mycobacterium intracellulare subsp. chimaera]ASL18821.1 transposase [Mycobacterium intracellulare subsp. chimaera]MDM3909744.1 IS110 family transposase [Mycobacterium intracellulare subsp. chimaera]UCN04380.1 IS110 family transposase [Mycobacterium intracellulare subsp. chimaera]UCN04400.1 IS110 family transposase [Mycobacterium intracellulare subsp. chimaera]
MSFNGTSVGLDVHALSVVAHAVDEETGRVERARLCPDHGEIVGWLGRLRAPVRVAYEAGPTGFGLARALADAQIDCMVAAPSKLIRPPGDRVKTDARDAAHLTRLLRLGEITAVTVPERDVEAARDLVRAREDARADLMRMRHRLSKLLLRQGRVYSGGQAWTGVHEIWLRRQRFDNAHTAAAFDHHFGAVLNATAARDRLDEQIIEVAALPLFADMVNRLGCLRGISALTGLALTVEIGDWTRFTGASIGAYVGLVPTEFSSGASRVQGSITKAGNAHVRRLLIEAAWHHRASYRNPGPTMRARWAKVDPALKARGHAGNRRLHQQWCRFNERKKNRVVANVAIARELAGWCWSLATLE